MNAFQAAVAAENARHEEAKRAIFAQPKSTRAERRQGNEALEAEARRHAEALDQIPMSDEDWREVNGITVHPCGLMTRLSNSGNLMLVSHRQGRGFAQSGPTAEQWAALGITPHHERKIGPPLTREQRREVAATDAMIRAEQNAPVGLTDEEIDEIGERAFEDAYEDYQD